MDSILLKANNFLTVHSPYLLLSTLLWTLVYFLSAPLSRTFFARTYNSLPHQLQLQWDTRVVALLHALIILVFCGSGFFFDTQLSANRLYGVNTWGYTTMIIACGYFAWDLFVCIRHLKEFQLGFLLHALGCFLTYFFSLDGVLIYYGYFYLLYEASTPFLNLHWFMDKLGVSNSNLFKKLNALLLILSFFFVRIVFGCTYSYLIWQDIHILLARALAGYPNGGKDGGPDLAVVIISYYFYFAILLLNGLNIYWFYSIIKFATRPPKGPKPSKADEVKKE